MTLTEPPSESELPESRQPETAQPPQKSTMTPLQGILSLKVWIWITILLALSVTLTLAIKKWGESMGVPLG